MKGSLMIGCVFALLALTARAQTVPLAFKYQAYTGRMVCDDKIFVTVVENKIHPHHFDVHFGAQHYQTVRVATDSGAIRLEDSKHGIVWLQMSNKSMLLNEKQGRRLAHNCRNELQVATERALEVSPDTTLSKP